MLRFVRVNGLPFSLNFTKFLFFSEFCKLRLHLLAILSALLETVSFIAFFTWSEKIGEFKLSRNRVYLESFWKGPED